MHENRCVCDEKGTAVSASEKTLVISCDTFLPQSMSCAQTPTRNIHEIDAGTAVLLHYEYEYHVPVFDIMNIARYENYLV